MSDDLKGKTVIGLLWAALEKFGVKILSFISNILLARKLTPDDYGCVGMLMIFILLSMTIVEGGFASALIQRKDSTQEDESTMFYWNIVLSFVLYALLFATSSSIADFYAVPKLEPVLKVQGLMLLVNAFGIVPLTLLRKELQFKRLAFINTVSALLSVAIALILAFSGFGIWSLVWQQTCLYGFATFLSWIFCKWRPTLQFSFTSLKSMFGYGSFLLLSSLLNTLCDNLQGLIIGKKFTASTMGYYSQAKKLEEVPSTSISQVVAQVTFPVFAKIQDDKDKLFNAVRKSLLAMNFVNIPLMVLLMVIAQPLFVLLFSDKWLSSVPYFQILCIAGIINCGQSVNYQVVVAVGRSRQILYWNIFKRIIGILLLFGGLLFGVEGILWGMVLGMYITYIVNALVAQSTTGYTLRMQINDMFRIIVASLLSGILSYITMNLFNGVLVPLLASSLVFTLSYLLLSCLFIKDVLVSLKRLLPNK